MFLGFILASVGKLQSYLNQGCRLSPRQMSDESSEDDESVRLTNSFSKMSTLVPPKLNGFHSEKNGSVNGYSAESSSSSEQDK